MSAGRSTEQAITRTASLQDARAAAGAPDALPSEPVGPGTADPLVGDLRRAGLLPVLVLHLLTGETSYGHQLMERIRRLSGGLVVVNPNTMYPLLRSLESRGLIDGEWEHPERRSRRFYRLTVAGDAERERLMATLAPHLDRVATGVEEIRRELLGRDPAAAEPPSPSGLSH